VIGTIGVEHQFTKRRDLPNLEGFFIDISAGDQNAAVLVGDPGAFVGDVIIRGERIIGCWRTNQLVPQQPKQGPGRNSHAADSKREHDGASPCCQQSETYRGNAPSG
jgi:hypothetical protein